MLRVNTALRSLNIESNFVTGVGMQSIIDALKENDTLMELKIDNQVSFLTNHDLWYTDKTLKCFMILWTLTEIAKNVCINCEPICCASCYVNFQS